MYCRLLQVICQCRLRLWQWVPTIFKYTSAAYLYIAFYFHKKKQIYIDGLLLADIWCWYQINSSQGGAHTFLLSDNTEWFCSRSFYISWTQMVFLIGKLPALCCKSYYQALLRMYWKGSKSKNLYLRLFLFRVCLLKAEWKHSTFVIVIMVSKFRSLWNSVFTSSSVSGSQSRRSYGSGGSCPPAQQEANSYLYLGL